MKHVPFHIQQLGLATLFAVFPTSQALAQQIEPQLQPAVSDSPYDLRGLKIQPSPDEVNVLDTSRGIPFLAPTRAIPVAPRMVAEWEPVQGALIRYPLGISVEAVRIIASELKAYVLCSAANQPAAIASFQSGGVNMSNIEFVTVVTDTYWTRDYGPWWVTNQEGGKRVVKMLDLGYFPNGARPNDDRVPPTLAAALNLNTFFSVPYVCQGGNVMTDSRHVGASTDRVFEDNPTLSLSQVQDIGQIYMGFNPYYVMTDPAYPDEYIRHIDCWSKFIAPDKVLVKRVPETDSHYAKFEEAADYWTNQVDAAGNHYQVFRVNGPFDSPYANHVILNDRVLVPIKVSETDPTDRIALDMIQTAYGSAYRVIGVKAAPGLPWLGTDSIHCRVNSVPVFAGLSDQDSGFIFANQPRNQANIVTTAATFSVLVTGGTEPYTYQWYKNNEPVNGGNGARYTFVTEDSDNNASLHVVVTDSSSPAKTITSTQATLTVNPVTPLLFTTQPASQTLTEGFPATFKVAVSGGIPPYTYQWYKDNTAVTGAISNSFTFVPQATDSNARIYAIVSDSSSSVLTATSTLASINVMPMAVNNETTINEVEDNGGFATATPVPDTARTIVGYIGNEADDDLYKIDVDPGVTLKINMVGPAVQDYDLYLFSSAKKQLTSGATSTCSETLSYQNTGTSRVSYYIYVYGYEGSFTTSEPYYLLLNKTNSDASVDIAPATATVVAGGTLQLTATVTGSTSALVAWTCTSGMISPSGLYTAPSTAGTYTVTATSAADPTKSVSATVTVTSASNTDTTNTGTTNTGTTNTGTTNTGTVTE